MARPLPDPLYRLIGRFGTSRPVTRLHPHAYRLTGGRGFIGRNFGVRNVIVEMTGARTGRPRQVPMYAFPDGERLIVVASNAGSDTGPGWAANLRANPEVRVRIGREVRVMRARETEGVERHQCWNIAAGGYPGYELYRRMTERHIPVFVLEPVVPAPGEA